MWKSFSRDTHGFFSAAVSGFRDWDGSSACAGRDHGFMIFVSATDAVRCANVPRSVEGNTMDLVLLKYWVAWLSAPHGTTWHDMAHSWWKVVALWGYSDLCLLSWLRLWWRRAGRIRWWSAVTGPTETLPGRVDWWPVKQSFPVSNIHINR